MLERPKPLNLSGLNPRQTVKAMLEATDRRDRGEEYDSPLKEVDPYALDELLNRIDSGALTLNQVPDEKDIQKLVDIYWAMREQFILQQQTGAMTKPRKRESGVSVMDVL